MGNQSVTASPPEQPKILSGRATLDVVVSGSSQDFEIEDIFTMNTPYNIFYTVDSRDKLLTVPVNQTLSVNDGLAPQFASATSELSVSAYYYVGVPGASTSNRMLITVLNSSDITHTVHVQYFIYLDRSLGL